MESCNTPQNVFEAIGIGDGFSSDRETVLMLPAEQQRISRSLRRYWQKLGFEYYDAQYNMMWTEEWQQF
jgi:hypothetical protein